MKKRFRSLIALLLSVLMVCSVVITGAVSVGAAEVGTEETIGASSGTTGDCTWSLDDDGVLTISGNGAMGDYAPTFPAPWYNLSIKKVIIEDGVTNVGLCAFLGISSIESVSISDSVTEIRNSAFAGCSNLGTIIIPDSVISIEEGAFMMTAWLDNQPDGLVYANKVLYTYKGDMPEFTNLILDSDTTAIAGGAFMDCEKLISIEIPDNLIIIGEQAFARCINLYRVTMGKNVKKIEAYAFESCIQLSEIWIPDSVIYIGENAFEDYSSLGEMNTVIYGYLGTEAENYAEQYNRSFVCLDAENPTGDCFWTLEKNGTLTISGNGTIEDGFLPREILIRIEKLIVENGVKRIGNSTFSGCTLLDRVILPDSVAEVGYGAFDGCNNIQFVDIGSSFTQNIMEMKSATSIRSAFDSDKLISIDVSDQNPRYFSSDGILFEKSDNTLVQCPAAKEIITIPNWTTKIGRGAFLDCNSLTEISIPNGLQCIETEAFADCINLKKITIPSSVTTINSLAVGYGTYNFFIWGHEKTDDLAICGYKGTEAENYAKENGFIFIDIDEQENVLGDSNGDGKIDISDATMVQKAAAEIATLTASQSIAADVNRDRKIDVTDVTLIQKYAAEIIDHF